jgi:hypothetical protein
MHIQAGMPLLNRLFRSIMIALAQSTDSYSSLTWIVSNHGFGCSRSKVQGDPDKKISES